jgi:histidinol-phosphate aminotransferase
MNPNLTQGVSRRSFMRILGAASAAASTFPAFAGIQQPATQAASPSDRRNGMRGMQLSSDTVIISSNENPLGPAQCALTAICNTATLGGRYHFDEYVKTINVFNEQFGLNKDYSALFPG